MKRKVRFLNRSLITAIPKEVLQILNLKENDYLEFIVLKNGTVKIKKASGVENE